MRLILIIIILLCIFSSANIMADLNEPILINNDVNCRFLGVESVLNHETGLYVPYVCTTDDSNMVDLKLGHSTNNNGNFQEYQVVNINKYNLRFTNLVLDIDQSQWLDVYYLTQKCNETLNQARSNLELQDFSTEEITAIPLTNTELNCNNATLVAFISGSPRSLTNFQYFTLIEESVNNDGVPTIFWGPDILEGSVHSNDDIYVQQVGGGNNGGWPTFYGFVSTSGMLLGPDGQPLEESGAPMAQIFRNEVEPGYVQNVPLRDMGATDAIEMNAIRPFEDPNIDIVYVKINGDVYESMIGDIVLDEIRSFDVYSWYPMNHNEVMLRISNGENWFEEADSIWTNYVAIYDTIWTCGPSGVINNESVWVPCELWIEGCISGKQTWGCADTVYIVGDITYQNTPVGEAPDDEDNPNLTDYFGLVSEEQILLKYKHWDPVTGEKVSANCNNVWLYGNFAAYGIGDESVYGELASHYDGIFSFEYQHPHGSTPHFTSLSPYTLQETLYTYIDLHKFIFPPSDLVPLNKQGFILHGNIPLMNNMCGYPYETVGYISSYPNNESPYIFPYGTDYPWYNPVWPESSDDILNCCERGTAYIYGSLTQVRRGFMHRSGMDPYNHPDPNEWDLEQFHYDGSHRSTGYNKAYYEDSRLLKEELPNYPISKIENDSVNIVLLKKQDNSVLDTLFVFPYAGIKGDVLVEQRDDIIALAYSWYENSDCYYKLYYSTDAGENFSCAYSNSGEEGLDLISLHISDNCIYLWSKENGGEYNLHGYDMIENSYEYIEGFAAGEEELVAFALNDSYKVFMKLNSANHPFTLEGCYAENSDEFDNDFNLETGLDGEVIDLEISSLSLSITEDDSLYVYFNEIQHEMEFGDLFLFKGAVIDLLNAPPDVIPGVEYKLGNFPNPFNPDTKIYFKLPNKTDYAKLTIYNIRGEIVYTRSEKDLDAGYHEWLWNSKDKDNESVSSGMYIYELEADGLRKLTAKMLLLK